MGEIERFDVEGMFGKVLLNRSGGRYVKHSDHLAEVERLEGIRRGDNDRIWEMDEWIEKESERKAAELERLAGEFEAESASIERKFNAEETTGTTGGFVRRRHFETLRDAASRLRERAAELRKGQPHRPDIDQSDAAGLT